MELKELQKHILTLATLSQTPDPVVSCYLNCEADRTIIRCLPEQRLEVLTRPLTAKSRLRVEESLNLIKTYLRQGVPDHMLGVAAFARAGEEPFFLPLHFQVPLPNWLAVD